jgi:hypothetical protein
MPDTPDNNDAPIDQEGIWQDPYTKQTFISAEILAQIRTRLNQQHSIRKTTEQLKEQGYRTCAEVEEITGISQKMLGYQANQLDPEINYLPNGLLPAPNYEGPLLKGNQIRWKHPQNNTVLLHPDFVEGIQQAEQKEKELLSAGYLNRKAAQEQYKIDRAQLEYHSRKIKPEQWYYINGFLCDDPKDQEAKSGLHLKWVHPYNGSIIYHPDFIRAIATVQEQERELLASGYKTTPQVAEELGAEHYLIQNRFRQIDPLKDYLVDGRPPTGTPGEITYKGSTLCWENPYSNQKLISPTFVQGIKESTGLSNDWVQVMAAVRELELNHSVILKRLQQLNPEGNYKENGLPAIGEGNERTIKGADFVKYYGSNKFIKRSLVNAWKNAEEEYHELIQKGYKTPAEIKKILGINPHSWINSYEPDKEYTPLGLELSGNDDEKKVLGNKLVWRHPYNSNRVVLIHPDLAAARIQADTTEKTEKSTYAPLAEAAEKIGVSPSAIAFRLKRYKANKFYDSKGIAEIPEGPNAVKGSDFRCTNPYSRNTLVHPQLVAAWEEAETQYKKLQMEGYVTPEQAAASIGLLVGGIIQRIAKIDPQGDYTHIGEILKQETEGSIKGSELYWKHPYNGDLLLDPALVEDWKVREEKRKRLIAEGYETLTSISSATGLTHTAFGTRLKGYKPEIDYPANGELRLPTPGEQTLKGSEFYWKNSYKHEVLIHPALANGWKESIETDKRLLSEGYYTIDSAAKYTGIQTGTIILRLKRYKDDKKFTPNGLPIAQDFSGQYLLGSELVRRNAYSRNGVLIHPALVESWKQEKGESTYVKGATAENLGKVEKTHLPADILEQLDKQDQKKQL